MFFFYSEDFANAPNAVTLPNSFPFGRLESTTSGVNIEENLGVLISEWLGVCTT